MFTIGGLSGVMHSVAATDTQQTDTYFIVAHFHYVLFGGALMGLFAGMYYWWPKVFGHHLGEGLGKAHFWLVLIGFNMSFGPMHILGLQGQARRTYRYDENLGFDFWNMVATIGAFIILIGMLVFALNIFRSAKKYRAGEIPQAEADPWDGRTLEWAIPSPAPEHNFDYVPVVTELDDFWHKKYQEDENGKLVKIADGNDLAQKGDQHPHLPSPSYWPIVLAFGLPLVALGVMYNLTISAVGLLVITGAIYGWILEPPTDPDAGHDHEAHSDSDDGDDDASPDDSAPEEEVANV
jgi:cytochrome c oxidase subunit 1